MTGDDSLPDPLTPADCDLRGLPFMPLDTVRLLDSDFFALATPEEFRAGLALWCKSWQQVPAGSLPDDDRILAHLSGARDKWCDMRDMSLHGWVKCSDGRLYHPVVCEKAMEALPQRREFQSKKAAASERKERERQDRKALFAGLKAIGITPDFHAKTSELRALAATNGITINHENGESDKSQHVTAKRGTVKGEGEGEGLYNNTPSESGRAGRGTRLPDDFVMPDDWKAYAAGKGHSRAVIEREAEKFRLHWQTKTGKDATKIDWLKTWQKWVLGIQPERGSGHQQNLGRGGEFTPISGPC
ncbi:DUF1376 domain-containing protein [Sphingobium sp. WCS2017Hpa-17]|uniref:DUF1376 domain-containing protein n=1 Tax=Sphingobium sp. WCS2017Hpa-17 TaxID=3073638 RepID=UPI002889639B|nr:DUF1376 domain-containing protein [Sphingobium sp. WCS2017Hpa-17]